MKFSHWLWTGALLVLLRTTASWLPSVPPLAPSKPDTHRTTQQPQSQPTSTSACQAARPAVVTLYANTDFGSGSIVSAEGLVLTNYHVVHAAEGGQVRARGWSGSLFKGRVVAIDPANDLALVQLATQERLPEIHLAKQATIQTGQSVCAIGSPLGRTGVMTLGTLKGTNANGDLQSSILLHPGNSGGPLLNRQGEMIGVNKAIWLSETGENVGIGFATTTTIAQAFIEQNRQKATSTVQRSSSPDQKTTPQPPVDFGMDTPTHAPGTVDSLPDAPFTTPAHTRLGILINEQSLVIQLVEPGSLAERAGLSAGDRLVAVDQQPLSRLEDLQTLLKRRPQSAVLIVSRQQQQQEIRINF